MRNRHRDVRRSGPALGARWADQAVRTGSQDRGEPERIQHTHKAIVGGHIRCYPDKGSANYLWTTVGGKPQQTIDLRDGRIYSMPWLRSGCRIGPFLCNGLSYITPAPCVCYIPVRMKGLLALSPGAKNAPALTPCDRRLTRGPAYKRTYASPAVQALPGDWPTFRHDATRESKASTGIPNKLKMAWETKLNGKLTQPVVAGGLVYVASTDEHTMYALDAKTGNQAWAFTVGGRIDSSPTWYRGRLLFGSADGAVYCLDAKEGLLAWRFQAAPSLSHVVSYGQLESLWPVHGTVLVNEGKAIVICGRTPYLDGGIAIYELNVADGKILRKKTIDMTGTAFPEDPPQGFLPDILVQKEGRVYSRYTEILLNRSEIDYVKIEHRELVGPGNAIPYHKKGFSLLVQEDSCVRESSTDRECCMEPVMDSSWPWTVPATCSSSSIPGRAKCPALLARKGQDRTGGRRS